MKKTTLLVTLSLCLLNYPFNSVMATTTETKPVPLDKIVAIINDDVVTQSEFDRILATAKQQVEQQHIPIASNTPFEKQVLNQFINKKLQLQLAKQAGISITQAEIHKVVQSIADQNGLSIPELYDRVEQTGMTKAAYLSELTDQITIQKLQQQEVSGHLSVSQEEITDYIRSQAWHNDGSKEYHLEDVLVPLSEAPSTDEIIAANNRAKTVISRLNQGQSLDSVLQAGNTETPPLQGGDLGWRKLPDIPSLFAAQVVHMHADQVAGPIQGPNGFHVIRLVTERNVADQQTPPSRKQVEEILLQRKFEMAAQTWVSKMRSQAFIQINL